MKIFFKAPVMICGAGIGVIFGLTSCKTQKLTTTDVPYYETTGEYLQSRPTGDRDAAMFNPFTGNILNDNYVLNGNDIIEIAPLPSVTKVIQDVSLDSRTALFVNPGVLRLPFSHHFFNGARILIKAQAADNSVYREQMDFTGKRTWNDVKTYFHEHHLLGKLYPQADFKLSKGMQLTAYYDYNENIWTDLGIGAITAGPYNNGSYPVELDQSGLLKLPVVSNSTKTEDLETDIKTVRDQNAEDRRYISQLCAMLDLNDPNGGLISLSALNQTASQYLNTYLSTTSGVNIHYPSNYAIRFVATGLTWSFSYKGHNPVIIPYSGPVSMITTVKYEYQKLALRKFKDKKNIYLTVFPAAAGELPFKINIKDSSRDLIVKPGDRVVFSF